LKPTSTKNTHASCIHYLSTKSRQGHPYAAELKAAGYDPTSRITQLSGAGKLIESAAKTSAAAQEVATTATQDVRGQFYTLATATVSLVEGTLGKGHELAVKLRGLRSDLIGNQNSGGTPTPAPPAPPK
jgi:hypothetical protein